MGRAAENGGNRVWCPSSRTRQTVEKNIGPLDGT